MAITYPKTAINSEGKISCGTILQAMNININIIINPINISFSTTKCLYLLCNISIASCFLLEFSLSSFTSNTHHMINKTDVIKKKGKALNKYSKNEVMPLLIITIAGKSPIGDEAPPVLDNASIIAKNIFKYFLSIPIVFNKTNTIGKIINTAVILFKKADIININNPNKTSIIFLFPLDFFDILIDNTSIIPVIDTRFVKSSITISIINTLN